MTEDDKRNWFTRLIDAICETMYMRALNGPPSFRIDTLHLNPGDRVVVKVKGHLSENQIKNVRAMIEPYLPLDMQAMVIDDSIELSVLSAPRSSEVRSAA